MRTSHLYASMCHGKHGSHGRNGVGNPALFREFRAFRGAYDMIPAVRLHAVTMVNPMPVTSSKYTYEDFLLFPEDGRRHEIIDGDHYATPSPKSKHQRISSNLQHLIDSCVRNQRLGGEGIQDRRDGLSENGRIVGGKRRFAGLVAFSRVTAASVVYFRDVALTQRFDFLGVLRVSNLRGADLQRE